MTPDRPLSIAAYGFVDRDAGSVASAGFVVLERLLQRGHAIDFHAIRGFINPKELLAYPKFRYRPTTLPPVERVWRFVEDAVPKRVRGVTTLAWSQVSNALFEQAIGEAIRREHGDAPFDVLLSLGLLAPFRCDGLASLSWPQGAPNGEWAAIESRRDQIVRFSGNRSYAMLRAGYLYKVASAKARLPRSDAILCGSSWSVGNWRDLGAPASSVHAVPYPFDLDRFRPADVVQPPGANPTFLCLGRIVPRKRVDLLLDAFALLRQDRPDARLLVIGKFAYAQGFSSLIDRMIPEQGVEYREHIDRAGVPDLLRSIDVVVQPSENEDIGSSVLEGLACGKPAIVGPTNGTKDYIGDASLVFDAYTPESLAKAMRAMLESVERDPAGVSARSRAAAERHLDVDRVVDRLLAIIEETRGRLGQ